MPFCLPRRRACPPPICPQAVQAGVTPGMEASYCSIAASKRAISSPIASISRKCVPISKACTSRNRPVSAAASCCGVAFSRAPGAGAADQLGPDLGPRDRADRGVQQQRLQLAQRRHPVRQTRPAPGQVQRQRPRPGDQQGERSVGGVKRCRAVRCRRGCRGARAEGRAPRTSPGLGGQTTRRHETVPSKTGGLRRCHAASRRCRGPARRVRAVVPRGCFSCVWRVPPRLAARRGRPWPARRARCRHRRRAAAVRYPASRQALGAEQSACLHTPGTRAVHARHTGGTHPAHARW
jgi:hypothetical protein